MPAAGLRKKPRRATPQADRSPHWGACAPPESQPGSRACSSLIRSTSASGV